MKIVCAWCGKVKKDGNPAVVSHGICSPCKEVVLKTVKPKPSK